MAQSFYQEKFNNSIITALLFNNLLLSDKEKKLQQFVNEADERYELFCDNIYFLLVEKEDYHEANTLYLTIEGFSFISSSSLENQLTCFPVLTINKLTPQCSDVSVCIDCALESFSSYCNLVKNVIKAFEKSA